jgi:DNA-binding transcriptional regulator YiaG
MNLNTVLIEAITKGAMGVTRKPLAALRHDVADLKRQVAELKRLLRDVQKNSGPVEKAPTSEVATEKPLRIRPTGSMVRKLRIKLAVTQAELAQLIGVSNLTVSKWESTDDRIMMRNRTLTAFAGVRGMGRREAMKMLGLSKK